MGVTVATLVWVGRWVYVDVFGGVGGVYVCVGVGVYVCVCLCECVCVCMCVCVCVYVFGHNFVNEVPRYRYASFA